MRTAVQLQEGVKAMAWRAAMVGLVSALALLGGGCDAEPGEPLISFEDALPLESSLEVKTPGEETSEPSSLAGVGTQAGGMGNLPSSFQQAAVNESRVLNNYLKSIRLRISGLMSSAADYKAPDRRVWIAVGLEQKVHALAIKRHEDGHFSYQVLYRPDADEPLVWWVVVAGTYTPGEDGAGQGAIWIDLDQDGKDQSTGVVLALWSRDEAGVVITASVHDADTGDDDGPGDGVPRSQTYHFEKYTDGGGLFVFESQIVEKNPDGPGITTTFGRLIARWLDDGSGRADGALVNGGQLPGAIVLASQCWAARPEYEKEYQGAWLKLPGVPELKVLEDETEGDPGACVFTDRSKPVLPPQGDIPETPAPFDWFIDVAAEKAAGG